MYCGMRHLTATFGLFLVVADSRYLIPLWQATSGQPVLQISDGQIQVPLPTPWSRVISTAVSMSVEPTTPLHDQNVTETAQSTHASWLSHSPSPVLTPSSTSLVAPSPSDNHAEEANKGNDSLDSCQGHPIRSNCGGASKIGQR